MKCWLAVLMIFGIMFAFCAMPFLGVIGGSLLIYGESGIEKVIGSVGVILFFIILSFFCKYNCGYD